VYAAWTTGTPVHRGQASIVVRRSSLELGLWPLWGTVAQRRWRHRERGGWGVHLGANWARAVAWRPSDSGEEVAVEELDAGGALARREEKEDGDSCGGGWREEGGGARGATLGRLSKGGREEGERGHAA
jgi:hypothetical protein